MSGARRTLAKAKGGRKARSPREPGQGEGLATPPPTSPAAPLCREGGAPRAGAARPDSLLGRGPGASPSHVQFVSSGDEVGDSGGQTHWYEPSRFKHSSPSEQALSSSCEHSFRSITKKKKKQRVGGEHLVALAHLRTRVLLAPGTEAGSSACGHVPVASGQRLARQDKLLSGLDQSGF